MDVFYDVVVIGGGPAGLTAAIYAARRGVKVAVIEALNLGGVAAATPAIENYPGFGSISGRELGRKMSEQAEECGVRFIYAKAERVENGAKKKIVLGSGETVSCTALVLALGSEPRKLGLEEEDSYLGCGLSYCATCDGNFFRGKTVIVAGGGSHAREAVEYLRPLVKKIYNVHSGELAGADGAESVPHARILSLEGKPLRAVRLSVNGTERLIEADGLFVELGYTPAVKLVQGLVETDKAGYIVCDDKMSTSVPGIFAAGDARSKPLRQIATAVGDGATAGHFAALYDPNRCGTSQNPVLGRANKKYPL